MNKTAIKNFAIWARRELIEKVTQKAKVYGIEKDKEMKDMETAFNGQVLTSDDKKARNILIEKINKDSFEETIEEIAYTWFNRFIAIRFMEVNGYMPSHIRVFTSEKNEFEPQILSEAIHIDLPGLDKSKVLELYNAGNKEDELFSYLFITQCNALNEVLPGMFQKLNDYTELLLPDGLLREGSVLDVMIREIPEEDWKEQVQIIGWLYQYYNEERKNEVINIYKGNVAKKDIPAATQLFTTDWVVRYIVDNSLGRYWIERNPNSNLREKLDFLAVPKDKEIEYIDEKIDPIDLRILDNCVGSGHFLLYEFDILMEIYKEYGYREREAAEYILKENLYGLDIDERARQLADFSIMMKARSYSRRILNKNIGPRIYAVPDSNNVDRKLLGIFGASLKAQEKEEARKSIEELIDTFKDGKNYGSIIKVEEINIELCRRYIDDIDSEKIDLFTYNVYEFQRQISNIIDVAEVLNLKFHVVATNPPYLNKMNGQLKEYVNKNYKDYKKDLFSVFMYRNFDLCKPGGYSGLMTPFVWMFIKSYEKLREYIVDNKSIATLVQMEYSAFEEATVPICAFVFKNDCETNKGLYFRLSEFTGGMEVQKEKILEAISNPNCGYFYENSIEDYKIIPGIRIGYWLSKKSIENISRSSFLSKYASACTGMQTGRNPVFVRSWYEVCNTNIINNGGDIWNFYMMGGKGVKWYGNIDKIILWKNNGEAVKKYKGSVIRNEKFFGRKGISWKRITSSENTIRYLPKDFIFDQSADSLFPKSDDMYNYLLGIFNTKIISNLLELFSATLNLTSGTVSELPVIVSQRYKSRIDFLVEENIKIAKYDWNMYESSWEFKISPLLLNKVDTFIESAYESYKAQVNKRFGKLKENEEELNRIFIEIYGLEEELTPQISDKEITIAKIFDRKKDEYDEIKGNSYTMTRGDVVKNYLSYFVGCAMGRYSLEEDGLIFAGGEFNSSKYLSFKADEDGILPLTDKEYFEDDIVEIFIKFLKITFGEEHINENLDFIASELKGKKTDSSREKIRNYFLNDFYKDHCKIYKKLPIYWQYDSGKNNACKGLFYLHRYNKDTFARIRINYVFEIQDRYREELTRLEGKIADSSGNERISLQKDADNLKKKMIESQQFEEKVQHIADSYIEIDLDDGVKENYKIFKDVLAKIR